VFLIFSLTTNAQTKKKSDAEIEGLRGKVISIKDESITKETIFFGLIPIKKVFQVECTTFNKYGKMIYLDLPSYHGRDYRYRTYYKYNEKGSCTEMLRFTYPYDKDDSSLLEFTFIYDDNGNETEENHFFNNKLLYRYNYKYDDQGNIIEEISYEENDSTPVKRIHIRDKKGNAVEVKRYDENGVIDSRFVYEYDDKNNIVKKGCYLKDNRLLYTIFFKYNKEGDVIERIQIENKERYFSSYKYKYDSKGNWIKRTEYNEDGSISVIHKRKIKYYKD